MTVLNSSKQAICLYSSYCVAHKKWTADENNGQKDLLFNRESHRVHFSAYFSHTYSQMTYHYLNQVLLTTRITYTSPFGFRICGNLLCQSWRSTSTRIFWFLFFPLDGKWSQDNYSYSRPLDFQKTFSPRRVGWGTADWLTVFLKCWKWQIDWLTRWSVTVLLLSENLIIWRR